MRNTLYYREIVERMSNRFLQNQDQLDRIDEILEATASGEEGSFSSICELAADALGTVQEFSDDHDVDWDHAMDEYADHIIDHLIAGDNLDALDLISLASSSGQNVR